MSRSELSCSGCHGALGFINMPSRIFRPGAGVEIVFIDRDADIVMIACPVCGTETSVRARRISRRQTH